MPAKPTRWPSHERASMIAFFSPGPIELVIVMLFISITVLPFWMIATKAGFPGWMSLAILIPMLNIAFLFFLAYAPWPALQHSRNTEVSDE
jgi:hypothetical protein